MVSAANTASVAQADTAAALLREWLVPALGNGKDRRDRDSDHGEVSESVGD
jgi:hypothetical protein